MTPPSPPWSRASATGTCSSAKPARGRICYTLAAAENARAREPQARSGLRVHLRPPGRGRAQRSVVHHGLRRRGGRGRHRSEARPEAGREARNEDRTPSRKRSAGPAPVALVDETSFEMLPKGGNLWVKNAAQGGRADRRDAQGREAGDQGRFAQRPPVDRHLFADRLRPGDGPAAEGMPGEVGPQSRFLREAD